MVSAAALRECRLLWFEAEAVAVHLEDIDVVGLPSPPAQRNRKPPPESHTIKRRLIAALMFGLALMAANGASAGPFEDGVAAFQRQD